MSAIPPLRIVATFYDEHWHRQHYKGYNRSEHYCAVKVSRGEFQIYTFCGEPECPIRTDINIIEVDNQGNVIRQIREAR